MEWQPIATYDVLVKKPANAVFVFKEVRDERGRNYLAGTIELTRIYGSRKATLWILLPPVPKDL